VLANGDFYDGDYVNGIQDGQCHQHIGKEIDYIGSYSNSAYNGFGIFTFQDVHVYEGTFIDGKLNGAGKYYMKKEQKKYDGEFKDGKEHGKGILVSKVGDIFDGEFVEGQKHGKGKLTA